MRTFLSAVAVFVMLALTLTYVVGGLANTLGVAAIFAGLAVVILFVRHS
jgi:hypothetical protein